MLNVRSFLEVYGQVRGTTTPDCPVFSGKLVVRHQSRGLISTGWTGHSRWLVLNSEIARLLMGWLSSPRPVVGHVLGEIDSLSHGHDQIGNLADPDGNPALSGHQEPSS